MSTSWGDWMGSCQTHQDQEAERLDRQKAALGGDTLARIKDLKVLIVGCTGVGVETAKNLILSNVRSVVLYDPQRVQSCDLGTNFYLNSSHVGGCTTRAEASLPRLKSLNPFCKVSTTDTLKDDWVTTFSAIVVTILLPQKELNRLDQLARDHGMAFLLAVNHGVTCSLFSDFGPHFEITDATGEPSQLLAISNIEVMDNMPELLRVDGAQPGDCVVMITVAQAQHGLDDDQTVMLDDMREGLEFLNKRQFPVKRVAFQSPAEAQLNLDDVAFQQALQQPTELLIQNFAQQFNYYQDKFKQQNKNSNNKFPVRTITMLNRLTLVLDNAQDKQQIIDSLRLYQAGGLLQPMRPTVVKHYQSFAETLEQTPVPQMLRGEHTEQGQGIEIHLALAAVLEFYDVNHYWPRLHSQDDANQVLELARSISAARRGDQQSCWAQTVEFGFATGQERQLDADRIKTFSKLFQTELTGFCAFLGGAAAQEVLKKTGKFTPICQWIHHDELCLVSNETSNIMPLFGSRYDHQIAIMGKDFQQRVSQQCVFLVGCGALGCEYLKGLSLMGVGTGRNGHVYVADMDRIEVSNLSRQFLFRDADVGKPKSVCGARAVQEWNPQMNITALEKKVGPDTQDFFNDKFWESLDVCWNALDNVAARQYTDQQCLFHSKPLLESGTLGTKCNHEVILPFRTSSYNDGKESDDNENQIAMCTLRSFPYLPLHCIEFAKQSYYSDYFEFGPDQYETFRKDPSGFFEQLESMEAGEQLKSLGLIDKFVKLQADGKIDFVACVRITFEQMIQDFRSGILNLCYAADEMEKSEGQSFWTGTKRRPRAIEWTENPAPQLMEYLYCAANMYAVVWGLDPVRDRARFEEMVTGLHLKQPEWSPSTANVNLSEQDDAVGGTDDEAALADKLKADLYSINVSLLQRAFPHDFEKDDDSNFHVDFLTAASNLRAWNYDIKPSPRHTVKVTAGRIIPALATTTAMVCGLVDIEFCKLVLGLECMGREQFLNSNINLAAGSGNFTTYCPDPPIRLETGLKSPFPEHFSSWDKIEIVSGNPERTVEYLVDHLESCFGVMVDRVFAFGSTADKAIYNAADKQKLDWEISFDETGEPQVSSDAVFSAWPQLKMAVTMLSRLPPTSGQRKVFESQVTNAKVALEKAKARIADTFHGPVSAAYHAVYGPEDDHDKQYFDSVLSECGYVKLGVDCHTVDGTDIHLPCVKYIFSVRDSNDEQHAVKRFKVGN